MNLGVLEGQTRGYYFLDSIFSISVKQHTVHTLPWCDVSRSSWKWSRFQQGLGCKALSRDFSNVHMCALVFTDKSNFSSYWLKDYRGLSRKASWLEGGRPLLGWPKGCHGSFLSSSSASTKATRSVYSSKFAKKNAFWFEKVLETFSLKSN